MPELHLRFRVKLCLISAYQILTFLFWMAILYVHLNTEDTPHCYRTEWKLHLSYYLPLSSYINLILIPATTLIWTAEVTRGVNERHPYINKLLRCLFRWFSILTSGVEVVWILIGGATLTSIRLECDFNQVRLWTSGISMLVQIFNLGLMFILVSHSPATIET